MSQTVLYLPNYSPISQNELQEAHWAARARMKKSDMEIIAYYATLQGLMGGPLPDCKRRVELRFVVPKGKRRCDGDNVKKSLLDALVACGLLRNDSPVWCESPEPVWARSESTREAFVILTDL
jgi:Holliday junction resolvase RusA-like endonuclease